MRVRSWTLGYVHGRERPPRYNVTLWTSPWWQFLKARLFHSVFCWGLFGGWRGSTWLGNRRLYWRNVGGKKALIPLHVWSDTHCKFNTGQVAGRRSVRIELTEEQYEALDGWR